MLRQMWAALICVAIVIILSACTTEERDPVDAATLSFSDTSFVLRPADCVGLLDECGGVELHFPVLVGGSPGVADKINREVFAFFVDQLGSGDVASTGMPDVHAAAQLVLADFVDFKTDNPLTEQVWIVQGTGRVTVIDSIVSIMLETYTYQGGAHPNSQVVYLLANARTGERILPKDLAADSAAFHRAAEQAFRKTVGMAPTDEDYASKGFWFNDNQFILPNDIGLTRDSVILYYNAYDIAPYSMGPTVVQLPRTLLGR